jgi:L-alanine-DL-glutamate epimerase-like enolase superfamily enzyme
MKLTYKKTELPFQYPFTISNGRTKTHQPALIVSLQTGNHIGFGEASAIVYYNITVEQMIEDLESKKFFIEKFAFTDPERFWHFLHHLFPNNPFLVCALDMAGWDLYGKMENKLLYQLWNTEWKNTPVTDYTIGIDTIDKMVEKMKAHPAPVYKIKLGTDEDVEIVQSLRKHTHSALRIDANAGWKTEEALEKISELEKLEVELIEQPLAKDNWEGMKILFQQASLPLIADESCVFEEDVEKCKNHFHGINIKLTKCSGITPALRMIKKAKELNLQLMMGSMNEAGIGSAAIANFLPQLDFVDLDGPLLLSENNATGLNFNNGQVTLQGKSGLGIEVKEKLI